MILPESPKYLAICKRNDTSCKAALRKLYGNSKEASDYFQLIHREETHALSHYHKFLDQFRARPWLLHCFVLSLFISAQRLVTGWATVLGRYSTNVLVWMNTDLDTA